MNDLVCGRNGRLCRLEDLSRDTLSGTVERPDRHTHLKCFHGDLAGGCVDTCVFGKTYRTGAHISFELAGVAGHRRVVGTNDRWSAIFGTCIAFSTRGVCGSATRIANRRRTHIAVT